MQKVYRIEIGQSKFWIGPGLQLFKSQDMAIPVSHDEHIMVMEKLDVEATAYSEEFDPQVHELGAIVMKAMVQ
jgi:SHS2 domain-containing protein